MRTPRADGQWAKSWGPQGTNRELGEFLSRGRQAGIGQAPWSRISGLGPHLPPWAPPRR